MDMDNQDLLFELFKAMFLNDVGQSFSKQIDPQEAWLIIMKDNLNLGQKAMLLQALVDEYVCVQKYKE